MKLLLLSHDNDVIKIVQEYSRASGDKLIIASLIKEAEVLVASQEFDALLMDCSMRLMELIAFAAEMAEDLSETVVLLLGPLDQDQREKLGRRLSAHYAIDKPLRKQVFNEIMQKVAMRSTIVRKAGLIGRSSAMEETIQTIMQVGPTSISVLITGESGAGKEVIARAIHAVSMRADKPFLAVSCASLAEGVLESELFGHEKGAFTGAVGRRLGMFEKAHGGTIFLDEIGEIPHSTQIRLLRVLEEREIMRVGGMDVIDVDVRVIAATNRNLRELVDKGIFRRDLYYRIKVLELFVPPLRQRPEDIPLLIDLTARRYALENNLPRRRFDEEAKSFLSQAPWAGNVRELRNFVESCLALTNVPVIGLQNIPEHLFGDLHRQNILPARREKINEQAERELIYRTLIELKNDLAEIKDLLRGNHTRQDFRELSKVMEVVPVLTGGEVTLDEMERQAVIDALKSTQGNRRKAARLLGIGERTLYRKLKENGLNKI
ncbi:MAG: sigma-54 dependent transcriptional regulator [Candidatus Latescibacter sp.]|nr:sigma-54 dependent transcriptional regulator [Candidatus Latescibacter sp.]